LRFTSVLQIIAILVFSSIPLIGQEGAAADSAKPAPTPELAGTELEGIKIVESAILVYSTFRGRAGMDQIRKTAVEFGTIEYTDASGTKSKASYEKRTLRGESLESAKVRLDQTFPDARYALLYDGSKVFGVFNNTVFEPRADAVASFSDRIWFGIDALMRYREGNAKVNFEREEKVMGVDYSVLKLTDKAGREMTFYVSKKTLRVMMLEYEQRGVKYRRKFYDYNYAQNTLFPYRTVLWADGKMVEEQTTATVTYGQEFGDEYFDFG